jgi:hypothetical protein
LLDHPVAQELLHSTNPAHLAYCWTDGTQRVVPIWFHWNGQEIVVCSPADAPKLKALTNGSSVAVTIDTASPPYHVLLLRGKARVDIVDGVPDEYAAAAERYYGVEQGRAWVTQAQTLMPRMARIAIRPEWVGLHDFATRFPSAVEHAIERVQAAV